MTDTENRDATLAEEYVQQGQVLLGAEKYEEAIEYLDKALAEEPMNQAAYISKGIAQANLEALEEAKECFTRAIMIDKSNPDAYFHLGNMFFLQDKFDEALKNYNQAIAVGYKDADIYLHLGILYQEREDYEMAIRNYTKAIHLDEMNPIYRIRKASVQLLINQNHEALQTLDGLLKISPDSFEGYHLSAAAYTMLGDYDKADEVLAFAESLFPDDKEIIFDRVRVLVTKGDLDAAIDRLKKLNENIETPLEKKEILLNLAKIVGQKDDMEATIRYLKEALASGENEEQDAEIRYILMNSFMVQKQFNEVLEQTEALMKFGSESMYGLCATYYKAYALSQTKDKAESDKIYRDAIRFYRNISTNNPARVDAYLFRAMCHKDIGEFDEAIKMVDYVTLLQPNNGSLHVIKGNILKDKGDAEGAQKEYDLAKGMDSNSNMPAITEA